MKRFLACLGLGLLLASTAAYCQVNKDDFARGMQELIDAASSNFDTVRGEASFRDEKGKATAWRSAIQIAGTDVTIYSTFATIRLGRYSDAASARNSYGEALKLVRATLPAEWKPAGDSVRKGDGGVEIGRATFQRGSVDPRVWVSYTGTPTTGVVTVNVGNTPARLRGDKKN
jgi:hypothetical protein